MKISESAVQSWTENLRYRNEVDRWQSRAEAVASILGLEDEEGVIYSSSYNASIELQATDATHAATLARVLLASLLPALAKPKLEKKVNEFSGSLELHTKYLGVDIVVRYAPPTGCTIQKVEETITEPERTYTRTKFVAVGNCEPLLAASQQSKD
jgi:hypothetical protein